MKSSEVYEPQWASVQNTLCEGSRVDMAQTWGARHEFVGAAAPATPLLCKLFFYFIQIKPFNVCNIWDTLFDVR